MNDRTLVLVLEATDGKLVRRWLSEGRLPALAALAERGSIRPIDSAGEFIQEATLASALTGVSAGRHGAYGWRVVAPGTHDRVRMDEGTWSKSFWEVAEDLAPERDILLFDLTYGRLAAGDHRTEVRGWGMRVARPLVSSPPELAGELAARHPPHPAWLNREYERSVREQRRYATTLEELSERRGDLAIDLLERSTWDLAALNFTECHYGGHAFYHHERPEVPGYDTAEAEAVENALLRVYEATDRQIDRLVRAVGDGTDVLVVSTMGMRTNECSRDLLGEVLVALGTEVRAPIGGRAGRLELAGRAARALLPRAVRHRLAGLSRSGSVLAAADATWGASIDWERSRAVSDTEPGENWIRINRDRDGGPVGPEQVGDLIDMLRAELMQLTDAATGEPAVESVTATADLMPEDPRTNLPDLLVRWRPEVPVREVSHPRLGRIADPGVVPRAEHSSNGFLVAAGPRVAAPPPGAEVAPAAEWDLSAIVLHLIGSPLPDDLEGDIPAGLLRNGSPPLRVPYELATEPDVLA